jgi:hypothetical protein
MGLQSRYHGATVFSPGKFAILADNGGCVEEVSNNFKSIILQGIQRFIPHRILRINADPDYYNKKVKKLKVKVRKVYNRIKSEQQYREGLKLFSKQLLLAKKKKKLCRIHF